MLFLLRGNFCFFFKFHWEGVVVGIMDFDYYGPG